MLTTIFGIFYVKATVSANVVLLQADKILTWFPQDMNLGFHFYHIATAIWWVCLMTATARYRFLTSREKATAVECSLPWFFMKLVVSSMFPGLDILLYSLHQSIQIPFVYYLWASCSQVTPLRKAYLAEQQSANFHRSQSLLPETYDFGHVLDEVTVVKGFQDVLRINNIGIQKHMHILSKILLSAAKTFLYYAVSLPVVSRSED